MTDINFKNELSTISDDELFLKSTKLLYFAYRDFIAWPDEVLQKYGFGRAHHRVLFFVSQNPGMTVAELLKILNITKQSLSRVLSALIDQTYITQEIGEEDRRQRLLFLTQKGKELLREVSIHQKEQMINACKNSGLEATEGFWKVLTALINEENREEILNLSFNK
ncbi:MAG: MarR family transcriptional regulator [Emcibacteraceae bacterium]|uniref:MarR family winged helix-turn-helix transcriptional regulator n=1 Tax=Pseudemcibacter sp. TaxID=2943293 RepID=UPI003F69F45A|nr:MarR family transcriptional regulator [Emcibacteraceae bacterium]MDG1727921.1 MarR family transcriptional regulator [Emcibacteraceae bacterium]